MATRSSLAADVSLWSSRDDVGSGDLFSSFLRVTEAQIKRRVRTREQEITTTMVADRRGTVLPAGFLRQRSLATGGTGEERYLDYLPPVRLRESGFWNNTGSFSDPRPLAYTVEGQTLLLAPAPTEESPITLLLTYVAAFAPLVNPDDTNWLLSEAYDILLYGCLSAAGVYLENTEMVSTYAALFDRAIRDLNLSESRARTPSSGGLRTIGSPYNVV